MLAFTPMEVADVCFPFEAAEWVALGRLPPVWYSEFALEVRNDIRCLISDEYGARSEPYRQEELNSLGVEVDYFEYIELFYHCRYESTDDLFNGSGTSFSGSAFFPPTHGPPTPESYREIAILENVEKSMRP